MSDKEIIFLPIPTTAVISFVSILDLAIDTESARVLSLAENVTSRSLDIDRATGKLLVPSAVCKEKPIQCGIQELRDVLKRDEDYLAFHVVVLMLRCLGLDVLRSDYARQLVEIRVNGRSTSVQLTSSTMPSRLNLSTISCTIDGFNLAQPLSTTDSAKRSKELRNFIVQLQSRVPPII